VKLKLVPVLLADDPVLLKIFISMGVGRDEVALRRDLDGALLARAAEIKAVLVTFRVPVIAAP
jgi:hypothetical protein